MAKPSPIHVVWLVVAAMAVVVVVAGASKANRVDDSDTGSPDLLGNAAVPEMRSNIMQALRHSSDDKFKLAYDHLEELFKEAGKDDKGVFQLIRGLEGDVTLLMPKNLTRLDGRRMDAADLSHHVLPGKHWTPRRLLTNCKKDWLVETAGGSKVRFNVYPTYPHRYDQSGPTWRVGTMEICLLIIGDLRSSNFVEVGLL